MPKSKKGSKRPTHWPIGLDRDPRRGTFRVRHAGRTRSLQTTDEAIALERFRALMQVAPSAIAEQSTFTDYCRAFSADVVPHLLARRGPRKGEPLASDSVAELQRALRHPAFASEASPLTVPIEMVDAVRVRQFLAHWLKPPRPRMYNSVRNALMAAMRHAEAEGLVPRNVVKDVEPQPVRKRTAYIEHDALADTLRALPADWHRAAFTLMYLLGCRPGELVNLRERDITDDGVTYTAKKTGDRIRIAWDDDLRAIVTWLQAWKQEQGIVAPTLLCTPRDTVTRHPAQGEMVRRSRSQSGQPLRRDYLRLVWRRAAQAAGHPGYAPRDIRPTSLTDEAQARGEQETRKGGQRSESVRQHYVRRRIDVDEFNSLRAVLPELLAADTSNVAILRRPRRKDA